MITYYLLFILAILPGLAISFWIYHQDTHEKEPHRILFFSFILGMLITVPAIFLEKLGMDLGLDVSHNIFITAVFAFIVVAGSEELVKFLALLFYPYARKAFNEPMDGIVYSVMIGMGFATLENILYVWDLGFGTGLLRMFTAVPAHGAFAVIMGYYFGLAKFNPTQQKSLLAKGFLIAFLLHGAYDFFLFQRNFPGLAFLAFVALYYSIKFSGKLIKEHRKNSPFKEGGIEYIPLAEDGIVDKGMVIPNSDSDQD